MKWAEIIQRWSKIGQKKSVHLRMIRFVLKENVIDFCVLLMRATLGPVRGSLALGPSPYHTSPMSTININIYSQCEQTIFIKDMSIKLTWYISNKIKNIFTPIQRISNIIIYEKIKKIHLRFMTSDKKPNEEWDWLKGTKIFFCPKWSWTDF